MNLSSENQALIDSLVASIRQVVPQTVTPGEAHPVEDAVALNDIGVMVGITGDFHGQVVLQGGDAAFGQLGASMFGMPLDGEMLHSFVGELGNMVAGNAATLVAGIGKRIDITPPAVMRGQLQLYGFEQGFRIPLTLDPGGELNLIVKINDQGVA
ncbi:chemotaxis protein CheX [Cohnella caldifontis]|uniref:chemotaxis protein CheX n=1 Tax=Cohnella caldifontis TaxID=3027471 RepID=UPI0023ED6970|nr:chemotaxis protein CheX [Cohnella sp. YIM B05605]